MSRLERVACQFREDLEHERSRRLDLQGLTIKISSEREKDRSQFAFAHLENERAQHSIRYELMEARQDIYRLRGEIYELHTRADSQHREHKSILKMFERKGLLTGRNPVISPKPSYVERRMRSHLMWQVNRVCVASAAKHTKWTDKLG